MRKAWPAGVATVLAFCGATLDQNTFTYTHMKLMPIGTSFLSKIILTLFPLFHILSSREVTW